MLAQTRFALRVSAFFRAREEWKLQEPVPKPRDTLLPGTFCLSGSNINLDWLWGRFWPLRKN